jgi:dTDP-4-amino-4,6-dideoxygalactose transaminase
MTDYQLAVSADNPVPDDTVPVLRPLLPLADRILPYLRRIDETRIYSNHGPLSCELERRLAEHLRLPQGGLACAGSGTAALIGAILAAAGRATAERPLAIIPAFTFAATAAAVEQCGYQPHLADVDADSWMLDAEQLQQHRERDRIGIVVPVAPFGRPVPQEPWRRFRLVTGIPVVIDGAASFAGLAEAAEELLGDIPVAISFHATKAFATGEGGGVACHDVELAQRAAQALNFGIRDVRDCRMPSTNGKMSEYHAAVGLAELDGWPEKLAALNSLAERYRRYMKAAGLADRLYTAPDIAPNYVLFRCCNAAEAERASRSLSANHIDFRLWYGRGLQHQAYYTDRPHLELAVTDELAPCLLGLPVAPDLSKVSVVRIASALIQEVDCGRMSAFGLRADDQPS